MSPPSNTTYLLAQRLRQLVEKHGYTAHSLSTALRQPGLRNKLAASQYETLRLDDAVTILEFLGESLEALFAPTKTTSQPIRLLRKHRLAVKPQSPDLRRWLKKRCFEFHQPDLEFEIPATAAEINTLRRSAPQQALHYAQRWVDDVLIQLHKKPTDRMVLTYIASLISWASVSRTLGHASDAAFAVEYAATQWGSAAPVGKVWASLLYQTGFVLKDLSGMDGAKDALPLLEQGIGIAHLENDRFLTLMQYHGLATLAKFAGEYELANRSAQSGLEYVDSPSESVSFYHLLAVIRCRKGEYREAQQYLNQIPINKSQPPSVKLQIAWTQGRIFSGDGESQRAAEILQEVLCEYHLDPVDYLLVFCDLAQALRMLGSIKTLQYYAKEAARIIPHLETTTVTIHSIFRFLEQCQTGEISQTEIEAAERGLRSSARR